MASKKPRIQFTEDSGSVTDSKVRKPAQTKLLTDEQKAKARKEQLRFGKKTVTAPVDLRSHKSAVWKGVTKRDPLLVQAAATVIKRGTSAENQDENAGTQAL